MSVVICNTESKQKVCVEQVCSDTESMNTMDLNKHEKLIDISEDSFEEHSPIKTKKPLMKLTSRV